MRLPCNYRSKIGYDCLIQYVILEELINIMGTTITDLDIELKRKLVESNIVKVDYIILFNINDYYIFRRI